ncbi:peptidase dimerization domain-containing protein [Rathayibacter oskolensis]|uniref:peptidase dimerization domain-containing protein n=1 Tax=Rathayibacter oskolensis TaxID=1891671 RepID=UPI0034666B3A
MNLELTCHDAGGHASAPPPLPGMLATQRLARAIHRLTESPFPSTLPEPIAELVRAAAPHADAAHAVWYAHPHEHPDAVIGALAAHSNRSAAMLRTTVAVTQLRGSTGANVLASTASAVANVRINPGGTVAGVVERIRAVIDDPEVEISVQVAHEPSPCRRPASRATAARTTCCTASCARCSRRRSSHRTCRRAAATPATSTRSATVCTASSRSRSARSSSSASTARTSRSRSTSSSGRSSSTRRSSPGSEPAPL